MGNLRWDGKTVGPWAELLEGAHGVINLTGESVAQKWTLDTMKLIVDSRVDSARAIGQAIQACKTPPANWINASAVGFYGDRAAEELTEASPAGDASSFLVECCLKWEGAQKEFETPGTTQSQLRIGFVCGNDGGGLPTLIKLARGFAGGAVGSGQQYMSWIHIDDICRQCSWILDGSRSGPFNGTAPEPVTNAEFMSTLRNLLGRPWSPSAPAFALKLASAFGAPDPDVLLMSQRVFPAKSLEQGFEFKYKKLEAALRDLLA